MKTRDEAIRDLADHAMDQCEALVEKMTAIIDEMDAEGEPEFEKVCGINRDRDGRSQMVFAEPGATRQRSIVYIDAILGLARMLNGDVRLKDDAPASEGAN